MQLRSIQHASWASSTGFSMHPEPPHRVIRVYISSSCFHSMSPSTEIMLLSRIGVLPRTLRSNILTGCKDDNTVGTIFSTQPGFHLGGGGGGGGGQGKLPPKQLNYPPKLTQLPPPPKDITNNYNYEVYPTLAVA